jgi:hypothetical protein
MRAVLRTLGIIVVGACVVVGGGIAYVTHLGRSVERDAQAYVDAAVPAIVATWSADEMRRQASPELLQHTTSDEMHTLFARFARLGPLVTYQGATGDDWSVSTSAGSGEIVTARFVARATFAHGTAAIDVAVVKAGGAWKIQRFNVVSPEMKENDTGRSI